MSVAEFTAWISPDQAIADHDAEVREPLLVRIAVLEGQVARVEALRAYGWANGQQVATPQIRNALAIPAEGGE